MSRESIRLALIAALQYLPPRRRAVLILRDVLGWQAAEAAALLGTTATAVNSTLVRARAQMAAAPRPRKKSPSPPTRNCRRCSAGTPRRSRTRTPRSENCWRAAWEMPPIPAWFSGREDILRFVAAGVFTGPGGLRMVRIGANGQPAFTVYLRGLDGRYHAHAIQVLTVAEAGGAHTGITRVVTFLDPDLFDAFGLTRDTGAPGPGQPAPSARR